VECGRRGEVVGESYSLSSLYFTFIISFNYLVFLVLETRVCSAWSVGRIAPVASPPPPIVSIRVLRLRADGDRH